MRKLNVLLNLILFLIAAGLAQAQNYSVDRTTVTLSAGTGGSAVSTTVNVTADVATTFVARTVQVGGNGSWLTITAPGGTPSTILQGTVPSVLTLTANPTGLPAGTYTGGVQIFSSNFTGNSVTITVTFNVGPIAASPTTLSYSYQRGGAATPPAQTISLTGSAIFTTKVKNSSTWLQVSPSSGSSPATVTVGIDGTALAALAAGTYSDTVQITPIAFSNLAPLEVPVTLTVTAAANVTAAPNPVNLNYQIGGATGATNTPTQTMTLTNPGAADLAYLITPGAAPPGWLTVSPSSGVIPANGTAPVAVTYATSAGLAAGIYNGALTIFVPGAATSQLTVPVKLTVATSPLLNVPSATLAFTYQVNGATPATKTVTATSSAVASDATSGQMPIIISATPANSWLVVPSVGVTGTPIQVSVNPAGLAVGTYNGSVTLTGVGSVNGPQTVPVTLTVSNDPMIVATIGGCSTLNTNLCALNFPIQTGLNSPTGQNLRLTTSTGVNAGWGVTASVATSAACGTSWLTAGALAAVLTNDVTVPIVVNPANIVPGTTCTGTITVTATSGTTGAALPNSPVSIPVTMWVGSSAMLAAPNPQGLSFTLPVNASDSKSFSVASTGANLDFTVSTPASATWLFAGPAARNTASATNTVIVAVNSTGLAPGTYNSAVTITSTGVLDSPLTAPVTLTVTAATMSASPTTLSFSQTLGGAAPAAQTFKVSTSSSDIAFATSVTMAQGSGWLTATPATATATSATPATVTVSVDGSKLQPGTYNGTVTVTSITPAVAGSPQTIAVTLEVKPGTLSVTPANLSFTQVQGGAAPASQKISVAGTPGALSYTITASTANNSGNWLSFNPASGSTPSDVQVSVNSGSLQPGTYTGKITVTSAGATGSPLDVPVTLTVVAPRTIAVAPSSLAFTAVIGSSATIPAQTVQINAPTNTPFTVTAQTSATWLSVTPASGTAPGSLSVAVNPSGLAAGDYNGTISINSSAAATNPAATISVKLTVVAVPKPSFTAVSNAASYISGSVAPGENVVIFGSGLGPADLNLGHLTNNTFDTTIAETQVLFDNTPAPIIYTRSDQTSVMVPYGIAGRSTVSIRIVYRGVSSDPLVYNVVNSAPGVYTLNQTGSGPGAILNQDFSVNTTSKPAAKNDVIALYMTGEGSATGSRDGAIAPGDGTGLFKPSQTVTATVGGVPATVEYYGSAPGIVYGVMQVNVRIPAGAPSGPTVPIVINVGNSSTQTGSSAVTIAVQ